ncbi:hypothetical protein BAUCODRAFT_62139 [Baudoinia panamericana UAMH 10762]|uniref:Malonyl-CoA:ACP transacylase (MAT) domain-containing protein n=1 Tax=Baudoinia panamericana (strain UAMH 10762) TaxID=717646 RepID=M2NML8_BAUPA|nr:uncharacterized protein BAUCODRAFT_62139 [Baudoinia panamericana UAMH 10762]EMD00431.1 hypothetical protein BAUCODRAFT_62139 [Baudoinia panamericana UAMH 10762]
MGRRIELAESAILKAARDNKASLLAVFGGQGTHNATCLDTLRTIYVAASGEVSRLIETGAAALLSNTASNKPSHLSQDGFDLLRWLKDATSAPQAHIIATAPFSLPLNGLLGFAQYATLCMLADLHPGQLRDHLSGATGHSQGIVVAAAIAGAESWDSLSAVVSDAMILLRQIGLYAERATPRSDKLFSASAVDAAAGEHNSAMLSIRGLKHSELAKIVKECNEYLTDAEKVFIALHNSDDSFVVSGPTPMLDRLEIVLQQRSAPVDLDQSKIPFPKRRPVIDTQSLPISAAFHSAHLQDAAEALTQAFGATLFKAHIMAIPVYGTVDGEDLRHSEPQSLVPSLIQMIMHKTVDWPRALTRSQNSHILDFGPSRTSMLLYDRLNGSGVRIISVADLGPLSLLYGNRSELLSGRQMTVSSNWASQFSPTVIKDDQGHMSIRTRLTNMLGLPAVMCAGMTPTTVSPSFVSSVLNAGYHVELACGGYSQASDLRKALQQLAATLPVSRGITCNLIYASPKAIAWQVPLLRTMQSEGCPIEGLTIGAGVPSPEIAKEYIETMGLKHISFKPSSRASIEQVLAIAEAASTFPIILQWTGGRAGGHHSYEDMHSAIIKTYAAIRSHDNIILVVGGGFGDAAGMLPYFTGEWSEALGYARMPFDGALLGSRMMVAREAETSHAVKELIVSTAGVSDTEWYRTYDGDAGGVITVSSEMGQPIHKIANRAVMLWHDLDQTLFSIKDTEKRLQALKARRPEIIGRLNRDYAKPWFAMGPAGQVLEVPDMTYAACLQRIIALMFMHQQQEWIHHSYQTFFLDFTERVLERFGIADFDLNRQVTPFEMLNDFLTVCPTAITDLLYPEDAAYFLALCRRRGQKPPNFIFTLDENFESWFKKDSLWQAEKLEAAPDQDPQRVCIIHGPVAARYSTSASESAADILDMIHNDLAVALSGPQSLNCAPSPRSTQRSCLSQELDSIDTQSEMTTSGMVMRGTLKAGLTAEQRPHLLQALEIPNDHWLMTCLTATYVSYTTGRGPNRMASAFRPRKGDTVVVRLLPNSGARLLIVSQDVVTGEPYHAYALSSSDGNHITFAMNGPCRAGAEPWTLSLEISCVRAGGQAVLYASAASERASLRTCYAVCWNTENDTSHNISKELQSVQETTTLRPELVQSFAAMIARAFGSHQIAVGYMSMAPMDLAIVAAWRAMCTALSDVTSRLGADLSRLLHRSNSFEYAKGVQPLAVGNILQARAEATSVTTQRSGKLVEITVSLVRDGESVMTVISHFFLRGTQISDVADFQREPCVRYELVVSSSKIHAALVSRKWWRAEAGKLLELGTTLRFEIKSHKTCIRSTDDFELEVTGSVYTVASGSADNLVGTVFFNGQGCSGNVVTDFLDRHGSLHEAPRELEHAGWQDSAGITLRVYDLGADYAAVSGDFNPIHVHHCFAGFAGLSEPIIHGMYTSAVVRRLVEEKLADGDPSRFRKWYTTFEDVVRGGDFLRIKIEHTGMRSGSMVLHVQAFINITDTKVLDAQAEIEQAPTAYIFTGQGSQVKGMGMMLYDTDDAARSTWDRGDRHLFELYGFSLLDIVRRNPKQLTIHFRTARGRAIRDNYLALTKQVLVGTEYVSAPVVSGLTAASKCITFEDPNGVLFCTQFAQPAISLLNSAEMASLQARGLVQTNAMYAGHSLGEYSALLNCSGFMTLENLLSLTFYRGLVMQNQIGTNDAGSTDFSMLAVNPTKVHKGFKQAQLEAVVRCIGDQTGLLLEIVNFNIREQQYVCAGHLRALWLLSKACDAIAGRPAKHGPVDDDLTQAVRRFIPAMHDLNAPIEIARGVATVPLLGVNVPFHSSYLRGGIDTYRQYLMGHIKEHDIDLQRLESRWIPNLTGKLFSANREYVEEVASATGSKVLQSLVEGMA